MGVPGSRPAVHQMCIRDRPQLKSVGIQQKGGVLQPCSAHPAGSLQPHLFRHRKEKPQRAVGNSAAQEPQHGGIAEIVVCPQGRAAIRPEHPILHPGSRYVAKRPEALSAGAHHIHMPLEDQ